MEYICKHCNKIYKSNQSRSNHYRIYHNNTLPQNTTILPQNTTILPPKHTILPQKHTINCVYCNKILSRLDSLKRHETICKYKEHNNNKIAKLEKENKDLINKFDELLKLCKIHPNK